MAATRTETIKKVAHFCCVTFLQCAILAGIVVFSLISYSLVFDDTVHQDTSMTAERANEIGCPITIPESASKVRFDYTHGWFERVMYVRFDADSVVCHEQINAVMAHFAPDSVKTKDGIKVERITKAPKVDDWGSLGPLKWFNISRIVDGVIATESSETVTIWIDDDRGIFYCQVYD